MDQALAGLTVLELCDDMAGAYCARQFAAWGARTIVAEPPGGSPLRRAAPVVEDRQGTPASLLWEYVAAGKESPVVDVEAPGGDERLRTLLRAADVLVTDWRPERLAACGLDLPALPRLAPALVIVSVTPFGLSGPYADFQGTDLIVQALGGFMTLNGEPEREPLKAAANVMAYAAGVCAFVGALAALRERRRSGLGQLVETASVEAVATVVKFLTTEYTGERHQRKGTIGPAFFPCRDGYVAFNPLADRVWDDVLITLGIDPADVPEALRSEEGRTDPARVHQFLAAHTKDHPAEPLFRFLCGLQSVASLLQTPTQLLEHEQLLTRGFYQRLDHPRLGELRFPGAPAHLSGTPMAPAAPAPEVGGMRGDDLPPGPLPEGRGSLHTPPLPESTAVRIGPGSGLGGAVGRGSPSLQGGGRGVGLPGNSGPAGSAPRSPLDGLRIVDLTHAWIGTYATMLLADLGADVVKVESHRRPDVWRRLPGGARPLTARPGAHPLNVSNLFNSVNRNKRSVSLDLATERGRELFLRLVADADLVLENFTPRVLDNLGLPYARLREVNPDVILVSFSGYGATGPYRDYKANGATTETIAGWVSLYGYPDTGPLTMGTMQADAITGMQMAALALVALAHRDRTGAGQRIDGGMFEAAAGYIGEELLHAQLTGEPARPWGNQHRGMAPHGVYPCAGDDTWLAIAVRDNADWRRLLTVVDLPEPARARFATAPARLACREELDALLSGWTRRQDAHAAMARLQAAGVPAGVVLHTDEVFDDPHFTARDWFKSLTHPDLGTHRYNGFPWRLHRTPAVAYVPPPRLGEHSEAILCGELGLSAEEFASLLEQGVTGAVLERPPEEATTAT